MHKAAPDNLPDTITVGHIIYKLRRFTPKRAGQVVGHDWIREVAQGSAVPHRSAVGNEAHMLIDEIVRLRQEIELAVSQPISAEGRARLARAVSAS